MFFIMIPSSLYEPSSSNNPYQFGLPYNSKSKITKFQLTINGIDLDNLNSENFAEMSYFKFQKYCGMLAHGTSNGIMPEDYHNGGTVYVADFSTTLDATADYILPSLKSGYIRLAIKFNQPLYAAYHLLAISEFNSTLSIRSDKGTRTVTSNYFV